MKPILFVIAHHGFQQREYLEPTGILAAAGIPIRTASDARGAAIAKDGVTSVVPDIVLADVRAEDYDGVFFVGGPGAMEHLDVPESAHILADFAKTGKPFGSICISTRILAAAGVLRGKRATGWNEDGLLPDILKKHGAVYTGEPVTTDGHIVTADGPQSAAAFGEAIRRLCPSSHQ
jgi:protease I